MVQGVKKWANARDSKLKKDVKYLEKQTDEALILWTKKIDSI